MLTCNGSDSERVDVDDEEGGEVADEGAVVTETNPELVVGLDAEEGAMEDEAPEAAVEVVVVGEVVSPAEGGGEENEDGEEAVT